MKKAILKRKSSFGILYEKRGCRNYKENITEYFSWSRYSITVWNSLFQIKIVSHLIKLSSNQLTKTRNISALHCYCAGYLEVKQLILTHHQILFYQRSITKLSLYIIYENYCYFCDSVQFQDFMQTLRKAHLSTMSDSVIGFIKNIYYCDRDGYKKNLS